LKSFKEMNRKKQYIIVVLGISFVLLGCIFFYQSFAFYEETQNFNVIKGNVSNFIDNYDVKVSLTIDGVVVNRFPDKNSGKAISSIECDKGAIGSWDYKNWLIQVKNVSEAKTKCRVNFQTKYSEPLLNGADPVLKEGLIPIVIDESGNVRKASLGNEWYSYQKKVWANAVILEDELEFYGDGEIIPEEKIESYFVWIPRYKYKIFNEGNYAGMMDVVKNEKLISIAFENKESSISTGSIADQWLTHPAFTSFNVNGIWVGKFETGFKGAMNSNEAESDIPISSSVMIKPNVYSWRNIRVSNAFLVSYDYKREMDSHMMKNTEWGAVAYLQHSDYGSHESVRINNNASYITGYAAVNEPTIGYTETKEPGNIFEFTSLGEDGIHTYNYKNNASALASTTNNRSGIYDMSGGTWEYVMGVMVDQNGTLASGRNDILNSNFIGSLTYPSDGNNSSKIQWTVSDGGIPFPSEKYYDTYAYSIDALHFERRIFGDATGEMGRFANVDYGSQTRQIGSWYGDEAWFVYCNAPWFARGARYNHGLGAGIFTFYQTFGNANPDVGFRIVLSF